jgi:hypothetical protein
MSDPHAVPPGAAIFGFISSMWAAQAVASAARFGIPDQLAHGPRTAEEVAKAIGANPAAVYRLMRGVASVGVFTMESGGRFALTPVGEVLRSDVPGSMRSMMIAEMARGHWLPWGEIDHSVRTGTPAATKVLGMPIFDYYRAHPEEGNHFAQAMSGMSAMALQAVLASYSFEGARKVVDVGGSHGAFLAAVLKREAQARGVLFDRPEVIEGAAPALDAAGVSARVDRVGGDFFQTVPEGGDVYLLKHILHDWNDEECVKILGRVANSMAKDGRVVVVEMLITSEGPPSPAPLLDLNMLVMLTGKERTAADFGALFAKAGLVLKGVTPTHSPFAVIEGRKA